MSSARGGAATGPPRPPPATHVQVMDKARIPTLTFFSMAPVVALVRRGRTGEVGPEAAQLIFAGCIV